MTDEQTRNKMKAITEAVNTIVDGQPFVLITVSPAGQASAMSNMLNDEAARLLRSAAKHVANDTPTGEWDSKDVTH